MGDVLEHMTVEDGQKVVEYIYPRCKELLIAVPYLYVQDAMFGNEYQIHHQPDLTHEIFMQRYPGMQRIYVSTDGSGKEVYGYYIKI
jgi:hypothetical protein